MDNGSVCSQTLILPGQSGFDLLDHCHCFWVLSLGNRDTAAVCIGSVFLRDCSNLLPITIVQSYALIIHKTVILKLD